MGEQKTTPTDNMDEMMQALEAMQPVRTGDTLVGRVVQVRQDGVMVDIGGKAEGFIPAIEWGGNHLEEAKVGDEIEVYVLRPESKAEETEGMVLLSKRRADYERAWKRVQEAYENGEILQVMVKDRIKGGLLVDLGVDGFVPASQVLIPQGWRLEHFIGRTIKVKIVEIDRGKRRVLCSNKIALEEDRERRRRETLSKLYEGAIVEGTVRRITDFGAFVDLGGIDGLLHVSEMGWTRVNHPSEVVKEGQKIQVAVVKVDVGSLNEPPRISLSLKPLLPDPWRTAEQDYPVGAKVKGVVTRIVPFGAFVRLPTGIEGVIPNNELSTRRNVQAEEIVKVGQEVEAKVYQVSVQQRRILLSMRQVAQEQEKLELKEYMQQQSAPQITLGDVFPELSGEEGKPNESQG
ncbi:MAG: 30S ribosomal protein S1 [Candidatus Fervidibacter sp.]|uniref:30S ribosomal protein S1 n=1 Tax=Candidatus Fervidibacter sp. TaxID=3100871 RepID=UPI00404940CB